MLARYEIRKIEERDYPRVMEIENQSFKAPWTLDQLKGEIKDNMFSNIFVFVLNDNVVGFYDYWVTFDSATIAQIAVDPLYRGQSIASIMMQEILDDCYAKRVRTITLEVRTHNDPAIGLYKKFGFKIITTKPHYYDNGDDAYYMVKEVNLNG